MPDPTPTPTPATNTAVQPQSQSPAAAAPAKPAIPSFYDDLDALAAAPPKPRPEVKRQTPEEPTPSDSAKSAEKTEDQSTPTTAEDQSPSASDATKNASPDTAKPVKAAELRTAYEKLKKEHQAAKAELEKVKTSKPAEDPEKVKIIEAIKVKDKRIEELEQELRFTSYEKTEEYQSKYQKPFESAYQQGRTKASSLSVTTDTGETRQGSADDFDSIMLIGDDNTAASKAIEMFGDKAPMILYWRERVQELHSARTNAVQEYRKQGSERDKTRAADEARKSEETKASQEKIASRFNELNASASEKYPQWFKPEDGDDKGNELLEKGMRLVDLAFNGQHLPPEKLVELHSMVRMKAGGFDRMVHKLKVASERLKELETELSQYKASEPGADGGKKGASKKAMTFEEEIDSMAH